MHLQRALRRCAHSAAPPPKPRGGHADFYASLVPAMIPIALLGSAVYMGLHLVQSRLAHEKFLDKAREHLRTLEDEVDALQRRAAIPTSQQAPSSKRSHWWSWF